MPQSHAGYQTQFFETSEVNEKKKSPLSIKKVAKEKFFMVVDFEQI
jgi:hypothetical protein